MREKITDWNSNTLRPITRASRGKRIAGYTGAWNAKNIASTIAWKTAMSGSTIAVGDCSTTHAASAPLGRHVICV
jgi:hypothetical protein